MSISRNIYVYLASNQSKYTKMDLHVRMLRLEDKYDDNRTKMVQRMLFSCFFLIIYCFPFLFGKPSICFRLGFCSCEVENTGAKTPTAPRRVY